MTSEIEKAMPTIVVCLLVGSATMYVVQHCIQSGSGSAIIQLYFCTTTADQQWGAWLFQFLKSSIKVIFKFQIHNKVSLYPIYVQIPNPLFDLAGITCGHFLVPFWTFFGATLIGKAIIKMHLQKLVVIIAFNESLVETLIQLLGRLPLVGKKMQQPIKQLLQNQRAKLHRKGDAANVPLQVSLPTVKQGIK
jgi:hypothetical protein